MPASRMMMALYCPFLLLSFTYVLKNLYYILPVLWLLSISTGIDAQSASVALDSAYGRDPLLYNGKFYTYHVPSSTKGTPFFNDPPLVNGSVRLRGVSYPDLALKYDVFNQQLVLQYTSRDGGVLHIVLADVWLESFDLGEAHFEMFAVQDTFKKAYQVIGTGPKRVLYSWWKEVALDSRIGARAYVFSKLWKKTWLLSDHKLFPVKSNKSILGHFEPAAQTAIKKYIHQRHFNFRKASDPAMTEFINFCNSLTPQ